jgi:ATP-dependent DNA ligase
MIYKPLYKRATNGKINQWTIEIDSNKFRTIAGYNDGVQTTSEWTVCDGKNIGKKNETTPERQAKAEADALYRKRKEVGFFDNIKDCDKSLYFQPMLAKDWNDEKHKISYPIFSQPKLDGIRCIVKSDGIWSRNGKPIISAPHIFEALKPLFENDPTLIFDGELYADKFANDFNKICSIVKKTKPTSNDLIDSKNNIQYHVYDLPSHNGVFTKRNSTLKSLKLYKSIVVVETVQVHNENEVMTEYDRVMDQGYEGQILRIDNEYQNKRSKYLLKHKTFVDEEFVILGINEGEGNKSGMIGYALFETKEGKRFTSNFKYSWDELKEMWLIKDQLIGKTATIKYFNLTPQGVPRFPYVVKIGREDYE